MSFGTTTPPDVWKDKKTGQWVSATGPPPDPSIPYYTGDAATQILKNAKDPNAANGLTPAGGIGTSANSSAGGDPFTNAALGQAQIGQMNVGAQTQANRPNQNTGFGSSQWTRDANGNWTQTSSLNGPLGQAAGMSQNQLIQNLGLPMDTGTQARDKAVAAMYGSETSQLDPQWRQMQEQSDAQLANQGLAPTSEAARAQNQNMMTARNQAYSQARANAEQLGNQVQNMTWQQNLATREMPLQELQAMLGLEQQPGFQGAGVAPTPDLLGAKLGGSNIGLSQQDINNRLAGSTSAGLGSALNAGIDAVTSPSGSNGY